MLNYDSKNWPRILFSYHNTVWPRLWFRLSLLFAISSLVTFIHYRYPDAPIDFSHSKPVAHTLVGVALGLLIVFRNNTSYDRFWEGRKLWGSLVNSSRNLLRGISIYIESNPAYARWVYAYVLAVKQHLRRDSNIEEIRPFLPEAIYNVISKQANPPTAIAFYLSDYLQQQQAAGRMDSITTQALERHIREMVDAQGACERIMRTPIPFVLAAHIKQLLFIYLSSLPFTLVVELQWFTIPTVAVIGFGLLGIEEAGVELEDPFGLDPNDLPLESICDTIGRDTAMLAELPRFSCFDGG